MDYNIIPKKVLGILFLIVLTLLIANIMGLYFSFHYPSNTKIEKLVILLDFDQEANIPSFFSALILFISSVILFLIASLTRRLKEPALCWYGLSFVFAFLSIDEAASIHEMTVRVLRDNLGLSGLFYFAWIVPYIFGLVW